MSQIISTLRQGGGKPSDDGVIKLAAARMQCEEAVLAAILEVESNGRPFDDSGRLIILPEKHVFWRELPEKLRTRAKRLGLAVKSWTRQNYKGLGGAGSDARWDLLEAMVKLHETVGFRSASYGGPQIMGFNAELCGFSSVQEFVLALAESENGQIEAFLTYLERVGLLQAIRSRDWRAIARRYNGPGQVSRYSELLRAAYQRITGSSGRSKSGAAYLRLGTEGYRVKSLQERLVALGYHVKPDGDFGPATRRQLIAFQVDNGLQPDGVVGPKTSEALEVAVPVNAQPGGTRDGLTVKDLRKSGSQTVKQADRLTGLGVVGMLVGAIGETLGVTDHLNRVESLGDITALIEQVSATVGPLFSLVGSNKFLVILAVGGVVVFLAHKIKLRRLHDTKEWRHIG